MDTQLHEVAMTESAIGPELTPEEFDALMEIGKGLFRKIIADKYRKRLVELGFAREGTGGIQLTDAGYKRIAAGK